MFEIIDSHVHIYPDKIAGKATEAIGEFYHIPMNFIGTTDKLLQIGLEAGISRYLVHSCATTPHQVHAINEFILIEMQKHPEFIGFMTLHPDLSKEEMEQEVTWAIERGFKGVKLHPDFQKFYIDEEKAHKIYEVVRGKLPILFHTGDKRYEYSKPWRLVNIANMYPDLMVIGAHFGGYNCWDEIDCYLNVKHNNVYYDTSSSLAFITKEQAKEYIEKLGVDHFFFGSDFPMWSSVDEIKKFMEIDLTDEERQKIFSLNIKKLLNI